MMLTTSFFPTPMQHRSAYSPPKPSPLSERSVNATPRLFNFTMASQSNEKKFPVLQRAYKANPVIQTREAATKKRRDMFFKRVQDSRDDKQWAARGEQIQHLDFMSERKRWEAEKARQAPSEHDIIDEEVVKDEALPELPYNEMQYSNDLDEVDHFAAQEEYELQQLIASMEQDSDAVSQHYGSDDDDYDSIFMELVTMTNPPHQEETNYTLCDMDAMDMD